MEEVRRHTLVSVQGLDQQTLDWAGSEGSENTIGCLLYHMALVEMPWLFMDILEQDFPAAVKAAFPRVMATEGRLMPVMSVPLEEHLQRLGDSRRIFLDSLRDMSLDDWHRLRSPKDTPYEVTPAWVVFHLIEHAAGHAAQIRSLKMRATG
ncbi:DinB family protein [Candidatus Bipolaricaulota bacterium]|nr:DinB family protein [Candidatus Bipolaricaulota bacterium]